MPGAGDSLGAGGLRSILREFGLEMARDVGQPGLLGSACPAVRRRLELGADLGIDPWETVWRRIPCARCGLMEAAPDAVFEAGGGSDSRFSQQEAADQ